MKTQLKKFIMCALCALTVAVSAVPVVTYCDGPTTSENQQDAAGGLDLFEKGTIVLSGTQKTLVDFSMALFPICLIVGLIILMVTKDPKKVGGLLAFLATVVIATGCILLVNSGYVLNTIKNLLDVSS